MQQSILSNSKIKKAIEQQNSKRTIAEMYANSLFNQMLKLHQNTDLESPKILEIGIANLNDKMEKAELLPVHQNAVRLAFLRKAHAFYCEAEIELSSLEYTPMDLLRIVKRYEGRSTK